MLPNPKFRPGPVSYEMVEGAVETEAAKLLPHYQHLELVDYADDIIVMARLVEGIAEARDAENTLQSLRVIAAICMLAMRDHGIMEP